MIGFAKTPGAWICVPVASYATKVKANVAGVPALNTDGLTATVKLEMYRLKPASVLAPIVSVLPEAATLCNTVPAASGEPCAFVSP